MMAELLSPKRARELEVTFEKVDPDKESKEKTDGSERPCPDNGQNYWGNNLIIGRVKIQTKNT